MRRLLFSAGLAWLLACGDGSDASVDPAGAGGTSDAGRGGSSGGGGGRAGAASGGGASGAGKAGASGGSAAGGAGATGGTSGEGGSAGGQAGVGAGGSSAGNGGTTAEGGASGSAGSGTAGSGAGGGSAGGSPGLEVVMVGDDAKSPAPGPVKVHLDQGGTKFTDWGFDIKQSCGMRDADGSCVPPVAAKVAASQAYADEIFKSGDMAVIRIPVRADELGVNASGDVKEGFYKEVIQAVKNAKKANPQVRVFASRSTISDCAKQSAQCLDYADSLKNGDGTVALAKYAKLLSKYLTFMAASGVTIDVLGVENEPHNNYGEGNLATCFKQATSGCADRFYQLIASLKAQHPKPLPQIVGDDAGTPDVDFADALTKDGKWGLFDVITTHYQSGDRKERHALLDSLAAKSRSHDHPIWDTEYHYDDIENFGEYADGVLGVFGAFDHLDAGFTGITWWSFKPRSVGTSKSQIQSAIVESTANTVPLGTDDGDGALLERNLLGSRAFRRGAGKVMVWLVNDTDKPSTGKPIRLLQGTELVPATGPARYEQWVLKPNGQNGAMTHDTGRAFPVKGGQVIALLPERSITVVEIDK